MSVTIRIAGYPDLTSPISLIKQTVERFIAENNLFLRKVIFAGSDFLGKYEQLNVYDGSTITLDVYPIITESETLFEKLKGESGGWQQLGKSKPVATLASGFTWWFSENWANFTLDKKERILSLMTEFLTDKNGYQTTVRMYDVDPSRRGIGGKQYFFYIPDFFSIACEIVGIPEEQAKVYISSWIEGQDDPRKMLLIYLVFGDYYKPYDKPQLQTNEEFMRILREYNTRLGIGEPDSLPNLDGGSSNSNEDPYKEKYLKYKNKYLELKKIYDS